MFPTASYTLYHGDCLDILPTLPAQSVDAVIADPPYGTTACKWDSVIPFEPMWRELKRVIKPRGAVVLFGSQPFTSALVMSNVKWFKWEDVWEKSRPVGFLDANRKPLRVHENIIVFGKGEITYNPQKWEIDPIFMDRRKTFNDPVNTNTTYNTHHKKRTYRDNGSRYPYSIIHMRNEWHPGMHPTQKPLALLEYLVKTYTNEGDTVLDFTMGSGTTGEACINTGRQFIGIEKYEQYYQIAQTRLEAAKSRMIQQSLPMEV